MPDPASIPDAVLAAYGKPVVQYHWRRVDGGFSGARVFAGGAADMPAVALKAWPAGTDPARVRFAHDHQILAAATIACVPPIIAHRHGTFSVIGDRIWELSTWMPGEAVHEPTQPQIENAGVIIAALHRSWPSARNDSALPAIQQRVAAVNNAVARCASIDFRSLPREVRPLAEEAAARLRPLAMPIFPEAALQIIHGDLHCEHILFTGDWVSGVIDFSSLKRDHPALDLARYFGEGDAIEAAVQGYRQAGGSEAVTPEIVYFLDRVILLGAAAHWIKRFAANDIPAELYVAASGRFERVVRRLRALNANAVSASASFS